MLEEVKTVTLLKALRNVVLLGGLTCAGWVPGCVTVAADQPKLAIVDFDSINLMEQEAWGPLLAAAVRTDQHLCRAFAVIDEDLMRTAVRQQMLEIDGAYDRASIGKLAAALRVDYVVAGTLLQFGDGIRLECTLYDAASEDFWRCRDVFLDRQSDPGTAAIAKVTQSIASAVEGDRRAIEVVVDDDFDGEEPDARYWSVYSQVDEITPDCKQRLDQRNSNSRLTFELEAISDRGWSSRQYVHLELNDDLHTSDDYIIETTFSFYATRSGVDISISQESQVADRDIADFSQLFGRTGSVLRPIQLDRVHVRIEISGTYHVATVYSNQRTHPEAVSVDLAALERWIPRIACTAAGSSGAPRGYGEISIDRVRVVRLPLETGITGRIANVDTKRPVGGAKVSVNSQPWSTRSDPAGVFQLPCPPGDWKVDVTAPDFEASAPTSVQVVADSSTSCDFTLRRSTYHEGDVVATIPLNTLPVLQDAELPGADVATDGNRLYFTINSPDNSRQCFVGSMAFDGTDARRLGRLPFNGVLSIVQATPYYLSGNPARIYRCLSDWTLVNPISFPGVFGVQGLSSAGGHYWCVASNEFTNTNLLIALDPTSFRQQRLIDTTGYEILGIACDGNRLWLTSKADRGEVLEIDRQKAWENMCLKGAIKRRFPGLYAAMTFADGSLWGTDYTRKEICRIYLDPSPSPD